MLSEYHYGKMERRSASLERNYGIDSARHGSPLGRRSRSRSPLHSSSSRGRLTTRRLFISNIPYECDWKKMKDLVKDEVGEDCFVDIAADRRGKNLGFGLLEFRTFDAAEKCIDCLNDAEVKGRRMIVREMTRRDEERWQEVQREKGNGSSSTTDRYHEDYRQANLDIPPALAQVMRRHGIEPPLSKSLFVANVAFECDERRLREVFSYAGRVAFVDLKRDSDGSSRGFGLVEFETEFEALQAICMFNGATLYDRPLKVRFDVKADGSASKYPPGVRNLGPGFGPGGEPLPHIGVLHSMPELIQLVSPSILVDILNRAGYNNASNSNANNLSTSSIAAIAAAIAQQTQSQTPAPPLNQPPHHHYHERSASAIEQPAPMPMHPSSGSYGSYGNNNANTWNATAPASAVSSMSNVQATPVGRNEPSSVVVSNLPLSATWRQLKDRFSDVGEVVLADIVNRAQNSVTGIVRFSSAADAKRAVRLLHEARFEGRQMDVRLDF